MKWIDEMFATLEKERTAASATQQPNGAKAGRTRQPKSKIPGVLTAWKALVLAITSDVNDFNNHKERLGQSAVRMSQSYFECEVYLPGMHSKRLVLTLDDNNLEVAVHPDFPDQPLTIKIELDKEGQHGFWVLGEITKESARLSAPQLSEYLLKPIFASADINGAP